MTHTERRQRRREIADYCRTHCRAEAAIAYGVTNAMVGAACREFGGTRQPVSKQSKCWSCGCDLPEDPHFAVGCLGIMLCNKCDCDIRAAQNRIRLPEWEAAHRKLAEEKRVK